MDNRLRFLALAFPLLAAGPAAGMTLPSFDRAVAPIVASAQDLLQDIEFTSASVNTGAAAQSMIEDLGDQAMKTIADAGLGEAQKKATFKRLLSQNFDMTTIGRFAMGRFWRTASPAQQQEYLRLYEKMIIDVYTSRFNRYSGQKFKVTGNRVDESGDIVVSSQVVGNGSPVLVDWRVRPKGGSYKIIDVMVEGVSMAVTQRNDFAGVIQQGGGTVDALLDYLKKGGTSDVAE